MKKILFALLALGFCAFSHAQVANEALINCAPATPCSSTTGPANTNTGDPAWTAFGKINENLNGTNTIAASTTGNAATATAFASTPTKCTGGNFSQGIDASGNAQCATPSGSGTVNSGTGGYAAYYSATGTAVSGLAFATNTVACGLSSTFSACTPAQAIGALNSVTANAQTGTSYTLVLADANTNVTMSNAAANTLTIPPHSSVAFAIGTIITVEQLSTGLTSIAPGSGVTFISAQFGSSSSQNYPLGGQYGFIQLQQTNTDFWTVAAYSPAAGTAAFTGTCTNSANTANARRGKITMSSAGNCTIIVTPGGVLPAAHGWVGRMCDRTTPAIPCWGVTSDSTTTATFTVPTAVANADVVDFNIEPY